MSKKHSQEIVDKVIELKLQGLSSRKIAEEIFGKKSSKSTVNNIYNRYLEESKDIGEDTPCVQDTTLEYLCNSEDWNISNLAKRLRSAQRSNNQLRKVQRELFDKKENEPLADLVVSKIKKDLSNTVPNFTTCNPETKEKTVEILISDSQFGKKSQYYNSEVAKKAAKYLGKEICKIINRVKPERVIVASLGDLAEDHLKHGVQSAISTDNGLAEQLADAIEVIYTNIISPVLGFGLPTEIICIAGNHGSSEHKGMDMYQAGKYGYDYTIARSWKALCEAANFTNVTFDIPVGCFGTKDIYGHTYLYEHGYFNGVGSEKQMLDHKKKRSENIKQYIHGFRCADKHHGVTYDNSNLICNGAWFGVEQEGAEYSGIMGFNSIPVQAVIVHEPTNGVGQSTIVETNWIQVAKGY